MSCWKNSGGPPGGTEKVLEQDPRPSYQNSEERVYGLSFAGMEIKFQVKDQVLHVVGAERAGT